MQLVLRPIEPAGFVCALGTCTCTIFVRTQVHVQGVTASCDEESLHISVELPARPYANILHAPRPSEEPVAGYCQVKLGLNLAINGLSRQKLS